MSAATPFSKSVRQHLKYYEEENLSVQKSMPAYCITVKYIFRCTNSQILYFPCTLSQEIIRGCSPMKQGNKLERREEGYQENRIPSQKKNKGILMMTGKESFWTSAQQYPQRAVSSNRK